MLSPAHKQLQSCTVAATTVTGQDELKVLPNFVSILFDQDEDREPEEVPACFTDLNIDQIVGGIVAGREEYDLRRFFNGALTQASSIRYRAEVFRDFANSSIRNAIRDFARQMREAREHLQQADKLHEKFQKHGWFLDAIDIYCNACLVLTDSLQGASPRSEGFIALRHYLEVYVQSAAFATLNDDAKAIKKDLAAIRYKILFQGGSFTVQKYQGETDYSADVLETFQRFKQAEAKDHSGKFHEWPEMNHIEAKVLEFVSLLFSNVFTRLDQFCAGNRGFRDPIIQRFDREIQFYAGYIDYMTPIHAAGLPFCEAVIIHDGKDIESKGGFDLALAAKLVKDGKPIIQNDFFLRGPERILVVSGPNQGGKTTFARMFGQLHYLACLGCPVPGNKARLFLFDRLFTHFEREETIETLSGKLQDDLIRIREILAHARSGSIVILNEIFTSTSLDDALFLSKRIIARIVEMDMLAVWVTFIDALSVLGPETVSMVSDVLPADPTTRTFRILRKPADGKSYAMSLAEKHGLTFARIVERIDS